MVRGVVERLFVRQQRGYKNSPGRVEPSGAGRFERSQILSVSIIAEAEVFRNRKFMFAEMRIQNLSIRGTGDPSPTKRGTGNQSPTKVRTTEMEVAMQIKKNEFLTAALERLKKEIGEVSGNKEKAMAQAVRKALEDFCRQEPEFAQAIVQGGNFKDCMAAVARGVGSSISDSEAFAKAARFYFPGSKIKVIMEIDLIGDAVEESRQDVHKEPEKKVAVQLLDLKDYF